MTNDHAEMLRLDAVAKTFDMHLRGGARLPAACSSIMTAVV